METKFEETDIGRIPDGWELLPFDDCLDKKRSKGKYQKLQMKDYSDKGWYPIVDQGQEFIAGFTNNENAVYTGSLPVTIFGDHTLCVKFVNMKFAVGADGTVPLYPNKNRLTDKFFYYLICNHKIKSEGYQRHLKYLKQKRFVVPPVTEQHKIAEILSTVDETIETTDAIIQETQQLKKGLMQKLFTEGIGHTRFKETKIGRIPEEWEVVSIRGINKARFDSVNPANSPQEIFEYYSIPAYLECGMPAIERGESILSNKLLVTSNTVLFGKLNPRVLKVWLVKPSTTYRQVASTEFLPILPNEKAVLGFIYYLCQSAFIAENSKQYAVGTTPSRQRVNPKAFYDMPLPLPPLLEQRKIAEILSEVDTKIETAKAFKAELEQLKKGLMQVLLTGKVRVKVQCIPN